MPNTNRTSRHDTPGQADRLSFHPRTASDWQDPRPETVQQGLDDLATAATAAALPVADSTPLVKGSVDGTKQVRLAADGVAPGVTRVLSMPDNDVNLGTDFASASHNHNAADINAGTLALARGGANASLASVAPGDLLRMNSAQTALEGAGSTLADLIPTSIVNSKGDLIVASGADSVGRLAAGANQDVLTADAAQPSGLRWVAQDIGARVFQSVDQAVGSGVWTSLAFDSEHWDTDAIHDTVINNSRLTAKTAGRYLIFAHWLTDFGAPTVWNIAVRILLNGTNQIARDIKKSDTHYSSLATVWNLAVNDYVEMDFFQDSGVSKNARRGADWAIEFGMQLLTRT